MISVLLLLACSSATPPGAPAPPSPSYAVSVPDASACLWDESEAIEEKYYQERGVIVPPEETGHGADLRRCYAEALQRDPTAGGDRHLSLCVVNGRSTEVKVGAPQDDPDPAFSRCIEAAASAWTWTPEQERWAYKKRLRFFPL